MIGCNLPLELLRHSLFIDAQTCPAALDTENIIYLIFELMLLFLKSFIDSACVGKITFECSSIDLYIRHLPAVVNPHHQLLNKLRVVYCLFQEVAT